MPRSIRAIVPEAYYHVLNRAAGRVSLFSSAGEYAAFCKILARAIEAFELRVVAFCLMPNHWHFVVQPTSGAQLSQFMAWTTTTHARQLRLGGGTVGEGPIYQGRYKAFHLKDERYWKTAIRYVERNAFAAGLAPSSSAWPWSSLATIGRSLVPIVHERFQLDAAWPAYVDLPLTATELETLPRLKIGV